MSYKAAGLKPDHGIDELLDDPSVNTGSQFKPTENDPEVVARIGEIVNALRDTSSAEPLILDLYNCIKQLVLPIDPFLIEIDFYGLVKCILTTGKTTLIVQTTLLSLLVLYRLSPDLPVRFCIENPGCFTRFTRAPDLLLPACTMLLLAMRGGPDFATCLVVDYEMIPKLANLCQSVWDPPHLSLLTTLISHMLIRVDIARLPPQIVDSIISSLRPVVQRFLTGDFQKPDVSYSFLRRDVMVPVLNVLDVMILILRYNVDIDSLVSLDILNKLWFILDNPHDVRYDDPDHEVYRECLKVWNRIIQVFGFCEREVVNLQRLAVTLFEQFKRSDLPRCHIIFVLSNLTAFDRVTSGLAQSWNLFEFIGEIYEHFNELSVNEKENANITFFHVLQFEPARMATEMPNFTDWFADALDEVEAAKSILYRLHLMSALRPFLAWNALRPETERLDPVLIRETLESMRLSTDNDTSSMATDLLQAYF